MFNVSVPIHLLPFLLRGERDGITAEEANEATIFKEKFSAFLPLPFENVFTPSENQPTQFCPGFNDVTAEDAQCYIFAVPTGEEAKQ